MAVSAVSLAARYLGVEPGRLQMQQYVLQRSVDGKEYSGLATIICQLVAESDKVRWINKKEECSVYQWLEYASYYIKHLNSAYTSRKILKDLNSYLENCSYLVGYTKTLADVVIYYVMYDVVAGLNASEKEYYVHLSRWFDHIQSDKAIRQDKHLINFATNYVTCRHGAN